MRPTLFLIGLCIVGLIPNHNAFDIGRCNSPLGLESGAIADQDITASSAYDSGSVGPQHGRLRNDKNGGAWCPRQMVTHDALEYLEINLHKVHAVTATKTQGRFGNGQGQEYSEEFFLDYWRPGFKKWKRWRSVSGNQILPGNVNTYIVVEQKLDPIIVASKVRFVPHSTHMRTVCMRVEVVGCLWQEGIVSYWMPQGTVRDRTYDGREESGQLIEGIGQLCDGYTGYDSVGTTTAGSRWVGWRVDTSPGKNGNPIEIVFAFDHVRNFSAMHLHTNNMFSNDIQVFSQAKVYFSIIGQHFIGEPVHFTYMPDLVMEHARNVTIKLHQRVGRFLKLELYFASKWILISEVSFDSVIVERNSTEGETSMGSSLKPIKEDTPQRDQVQTNPNKDHPKTDLSANKAMESRQLVALVIGFLTAVILLLIVAIVFIVVRNRMLKGDSMHTRHFAPEKSVTINMKVSMEEPEKSVLYHEPFNNMSVYASDGLQLDNCLVQRQIGSPDYSADTMTQEYAVPHVNSAISAYNKFSTHPKPPPVPPPPEKYYAATEICQKTPTVPVSPPPSAKSSLSTHGGTTSSSTYSYLSPHIKLQEPHLFEIQELPKDSFKVLRRLGVGHFGEIHLCEVMGTAEISHCKYVALKSLRQNASDIIRCEFIEEIEVLSKLRDINLTQVLGIGLCKEPFYIVFEYMQYGDLYQFLQDHIAETATTLTTSANILSYGCLIYMATQIASGMKYLESVKFVHRDLAARNCLVGQKYSIKVSDFGIGKCLYSADYYEFDGKEALPIRWMAWESILMGKFSTKSDVWSFAVTLWEILTFAREQPFEEFSDQGVIENVTQFYQDSANKMILPQPINCPREIYDLMCECWQRNEVDRPNFREIHLFLQRKNLGYKPERN